MAALEGWESTLLKQFNKDSYKVSQNGSSQAACFCLAGQEVKSSACEVEQFLPQSKRERKSTRAFWWIISYSELTQASQEQWPSLTRVDSSIHCPALHHAWCGNNGPFSPLPNPSPAFQQTFSFKSHFLILLSLIKAHLLSL